MTDIIELIYDDISMDGGITSRELRDLYRKMDAQWQKVEPLLGSETTEKLQSYIARIEGQATLEWFREGFRVGLSLAKEVL